MGGACLSQEFSTEEYHIAETHLKRWSTSLAIKEMQIKNILNFILYQTE